MKVWDVVIVGGGILGHAIAEALTCAGHQVALLSGSGALDVECASTAAGAMIGALGEITAGIEESCADIDYRIQAARLYGPMIERLRTTTGIEPSIVRGTAVVANREGKCDLESLDAIASNALARGERAERVSWRDVPGLRPSRDLQPSGCLWLPDEIAIDPTALIEIFAVALTRAGCRVSREQVLRVHKSEDTWLTETGENVVYTSRHLVLAAGARTANLVGKELWQELGLPSLFFGKGASCVVHYEEGSPPEVVLRTPNRAFACGIHLVPRQAKSAYVGATNFFGEDFERECGVEAGELHMLLDQSISQLDSRIRRSKLVSWRYGLRPVLATQNPIVGQTHLAGLHVATGTYRNGILMAPLIAKHICQEISDHRRPLDNPYSPTRSFSVEMTDAISVVEAGLDDLIEMLREPGGFLPYDRSNELLGFIKNLWALAFTESGETQEMKAAVLARLNRVPRTETINRVFYDIIGMSSSGTVQGKREDGKG